MNVLHGFEALADPREPAAVTIGFFDGVHRGHQAVLGRTVRAAGARGLRPFAVTFDRHPREILTPGREPRLLTTLERKLLLIEQTGIHSVAVLAFDRDFSEWEPAEFVDRVLVTGLDARHVVVGTNFTFGHRAVGNLPILVELGAAGGFSAEGVSLLALGGRPVSSSSIREALQSGDLDWPTEALGRRFVVDGVVARGAGRGQRIGFPTANLEVSPRLLLPGVGVYAGKATVGDDVYVAAINVGTNPTFGEEPLHLEAHLLDFDGELRGRPLSVEFWARLREETRFESVDELARQIGRDVERTRELVG